MSKIYFSKEHEWIKEDNGDDAIFRLGITDHAQDSLGEVVYVELPTVGEQVTKDAQVAVVESSKAASDIYTPVSGEIIAVNEQLENTPNLVNSDPMDKGWIFSIKLSDSSELSSLLSEENYKTFVGEE